MGKPYLAGSGSNQIGAVSQSWRGPTGVVSQSAGAMSPGAIAYVPFDVGPDGETFDAIGVNVTTAAVGGTGNAFRLGVSPDRGDGCKPGGTLLYASGDVVSTALGLQSEVFASDLVLPPGRYWLCCKYAYATAPAPGAQLFLVASMLTLPSNGTTSLWTAGNRCWSTTGQSTGALPSTPPAGIVLGTGNAASVALRTK